MQDQHAVLQPTPGHNAFCIQHSEPILAIARARAPQSQDVYDLPGAGPASSLSFDV